MTRITPDGVCATHMHSYTFTSDESSTETDRATNQSQPSLLVVQDTVAPSVLITVPTRASNATIPVSWSASDAGSGLSNLYTVSVIDPLAEGRLTQVHSKSGLMIPRRLRLTLQASLDIGIHLS